MLANWACMHGVTGLNHFSFLKPPLCYFTWHKEFYLTTYCIFRNSATIHHCMDLLKVALLTKLTNLFVRHVGITDCRKFKNAIWSCPQQHNITKFPSNPSCGSRVKSCELRQGQIYVLISCTSCNIKGAHQNAFLNLIHCSE